MAKNNIKSIFGKALKDLRESRGLTQEQLAEKLELQAYQTISLIENGKSFVCIHTTFAIAINPIINKCKKIKF